MTRYILMLAFMASPFAAHADRLRPPADAPASFQAECGSCHVAFPPQLLAADDWRKVMASLDKHYGDNADLDEKTRREIEAFLAKNAGADRVAPQTVAAGNLPRITTGNWFVRKHREVRAADWKHDKVKSPANCAGCHTKAAAGSYREREIVMPDGRRWEDD